jgi:hypothetical protein
MRHLKAHRRLLMKQDQRRRVQWRAYSGESAAFKGDIEEGDEMIAFSGNVGVVTIKARTVNGPCVRD